MDHTEPIIKTNVASTVYLYGVEPIYFKDMKYQEVLEEKIKLAKNKASELYDIQMNSEKDKYLELEYILNDIYRAIEHNKQLLNEFKTSLKKNNVNL